ncbi:hypothetical protein ACFX1S_009397 [Malus domestica]
MGDKDNGFVSFTSSAMALNFKEENKQGQEELCCLIETKHSREDDDKKQFWIGDGLCAFSFSVSVSFVLVGYGERHEFRGREREP